MQEHESLCYGNGTWHANRANVLPHHFHYSTLPSSRLSFRRQLPIFHLLRWLNDKCLSMTCDFYIYMGNSLSLYTLHVFKQFSKSNFNRFNFETAKIITKTCKLDMVLVFLHAVLIRFKKLFESESERERENRSCCVFWQTARKTHFRCSKRNSNNNIWIVPHTSRYDSLSFSHTLQRCSFSFRCSQHVILVRTRSMRSCSRHRQKKNCGCKIKCVVGYCVSVLWIDFSSETLMFVVSAHTCSTQLYLDEVHCNLNRLMGQGSKKRRSI